MAGVPRLLEQRDAGEPLDDIVIDAVAPDGSAARLGLQVKREGALQPDTPVALEALDDALLSLVDELISDGLLEDSGNQHFVRFAHDIFFEWSFAQLLIGAGGNWLGGGPGTLSGCLLPAPNDKAAAAECL